MYVFHTYTLVEKKSVLMDDYIVFVIGVVAEGFIIFAANFSMNSYFRIRNCEALILQGAIS